LSRAIRFAVLAGVSAATWTSGLIVGGSLLLQAQGG